MFFDKNFSLPTGYRFLLNDVIYYINVINLAGLKYGSTPSLLDLGSGQQPYKKFLTNWEYIGLDNSSESQAKPDLDGSITSIPLLDDSIDACMSVWLLDDVFDINTAISEISRVLKTGGFYYAIENQSTHLHNPPHDYFRFAPNALKEICSQHGLQLIEYRSFAGDFANIGFSLILVNRILFSNIKIDRIMRPLYSLIINLIFRPLDKFFRIKIFKNKFEINSLGYFYIFKKVGKS